MFLKLSSEQNAEFFNIVVCYKAEFFCRSSDAEPLYPSHYLDLPCAPEFEASSSQHEFGTPVIPPRFLKPKPR